MRALVLMLALACAGCVSLTPQQADRLAEMQRFADKTTALYRMPSIRISVQPSTNLNIGAIYRQGNVLVNVRMLDSPHLIKLMAHELGHYVLGHDSIIPQAVSQAEWERAAQTRGAPLTPGHLPASSELADLLARFPAAAALTR